MIFNKKKLGINFIFGAEIYETGVKAAQRPFLSFRGKFYKTTWACKINGAVDEVTGPG